MLIGSFDPMANQGLIYTTTDGGLTYSGSMAVGAQPLYSIATSPGFSTDRGILVGNTAGWVYRSESGAPFVPLPTGASSPPLAGSVSVAFDPRFAGTVYAATDAPDGDIYRFSTGSSIWQGIDGTLPRGRPSPSRIMSLRVAADGTLYAANAQPASAVGEGGVERSLDPNSGAPTFETVAIGLEGGGTLYGIWLSGLRLWAMDTAGNRLFTLVDSLRAPVALAWPDDQASGVRDVALEWAPLPGATSYRWQVARGADFSVIYLEGAVSATSARLDSLEPGTAYWWRVRAVEPLLGPWSGARSFTTSLGSGVVLRIPSAGARRVALAPLFRWSGLADALAYELLVATDASFGNLVIGRTTGETAWQSDVRLENETTYYWKVRAVGAGAYSEWSATGAFTTEPAAEPSPAPTLLLAPPALVSPEPGASGILVRPAFMWRAVGGAAGYELVVSTASAFTAPIVTRTVAVTAWECDVSLDCGRLYFWRVRAVNGGSPGVWSDASAFTTETPLVAPPPPAPVPCGPTGPGIPTRPLFEWEGVPGGSGYELMVSRDAGFASSVIARTGDFAASTWRCDVSLEPDTAYFWRVRAVSPGVYGEWSRTQAFTTLQAPQPSPVSTQPAVPIWAVWLACALLTVAVILLSVLLVLRLRRPSG